MRDRRLSHGLNTDETRIGAAIRLRLRLAFVIFVLFRGSKLGRTSREKVQRSQKTSNSKYSPSHSQVPKRSQMISKRSQIIPSKPFFNPLSVKHMPFFRRISRSLVLFFRGTRRAAFQAPPALASVPSSSQSPQRNVAKRRNSRFILGSSWVHPGFILGSSWVHPGFILGSS